MSGLLSVIIPCLNEEDNIVRVLDEVTKMLVSNSIPYEIIVVDDRSTDSTLNTAESWVRANESSNVKVIHKDLDRRGYGAVLKYGIAHAQGRYVVFVSADLVDPIGLIPLMYCHLNEGYDLVQVSRYMNLVDASTIPFSYKFFQFFYRFGVFIALGSRIPDSTYSFKMFDRAKVLATGLASNRFNISPEIMFKAILAGYSIRFIPGSQGVREGGVSKFRFHKEGIGFGLCLFRAYLHRKKLIFWF